MSTESLNLRIESSLYDTLKLHCVSNGITMTSWVQESIIMRLGVQKPIDEAEKRRSTEEQEMLKGAELYHTLIEVVWPAIKDLPMTSTKGNDQMWQLRGMALKFKEIGLDPVDGIQVFVEQSEGLIQKGKVPVEILEAFKLSLAKARLCRALMHDFRKLKLEEAVYTMEEPKHE